MKKMFALLMVFCLLLSVCSSAFATSASEPNVKKEAPVTKKGKVMNKTEEAMDDIIVNEPPKNWNPLNASAEELNFYNYPAKPEDPEKIKEWEKIVSGKWVRPSFEKRAEKISHFGEKNEKKNPKSQTVSNNVYSSVSADVANLDLRSPYSQNWAGQILYNDDNYNGVNGKYNRVVGQWTFPYVAGNNNLNTREASWIGIGGYALSNWMPNGRAPLIQIGTESNANNWAGDYYAWFQLVGTTKQTPFGTTNPTDSRQYVLYKSCGYSEVVVPGACEFLSYPGHKIYADIWLEYNRYQVDLNGNANGNSTAHFYIRDFDSGEVASFSVGPIGNWWGTNTSAEWIDERPYDNGVLSNLSSFNPIPWSNMRAGQTFDAGFTGTFVPHYNHLDLIRKTMVNDYFNYKSLAHPNTLINGAFNEYWDAYY